MQECAELFDFYAEIFGVIIDEYKTIQKDVRVKALHRLITEKTNFQNDKQ